MSKGLEKLAKIKKVYVVGIKETQEERKEDIESIEKELNQHEKLKNFIYKEKEKIDKQIKELDPDYNESISDCEECEMWSRLFSKQELLEKIIKEVEENE